MYAAIAPPATIHNNSFTAAAHISRNGDIVFASSGGLGRFDSKSEFSRHRRERPREVTANSAQHRNGSYGNQCGDQGVFYRGGGSLAPEKARQSRKHGCCPIEPLTFGTLVSTTC